MKDVSIIIPVYNKEQYIYNCLESITSLMDDSFEVIIVDDGSTDQSFLEYNKFADKIKIIKQKNGGVSSARNTGLRHAIGKYVMFVDSDDTLSKNWVDIIKKGLLSDNDLVVFSKNNTNLHSDFIEKIYSLLNIKNNGSHLANPVSKLYKTEFIKKNNLYFDTGIKNGEDMLFNFKFLIANPSISYINESFYYYYLNETSVANRFQLSEIESDYSFQLLLRNIVNSSNSFTEEEKNIIISNMSLNGLSYLFGKIINYYSLLKYKSIIDKINLTDYLNNISFSNIISGKKKFVLVFLKIRFFFPIWILYKLKNSKQKNTIVEI